MAAKWGAEVKKIISLFQRDYWSGGQLVYNEIVPGAEWVANGEGVATEKFDGTACMVRDGVLWKRYDCKRGRTPPTGWEPCEAAPNEHTGHWPGWVRVGDGPADRWHRETYATYTSGLPDGTYELVGPQINGNPHNIRERIFLRHGSIKFDDAPRDFDGVRDFLQSREIEGIVWHHPDGRMVKIRRTDFGFAWGAKKGLAK